MGKSISKSQAGNLLLLQSAVGNVNKNVIEKPPTEDNNEMKFDEETSKFFIFEGDGGSKIYIPKNKIDTEVPIEIDEHKNILQNGKLILTKDEARGGNHIITRGGSRGYV